MKPDAKIYEILLNRFNLKAEECLFIDDVKIILNQVITDRGWVLGSESKQYVRFFTTKIKDFIYIYLGILGCVGSQNLGG